MEQPREETRLRPIPHCLCPRGDSDNFIEYPLMREWTFDDYIKLKRVLCHLFIFRLYITQFQAELYLNTNYSSSFQPGCLLNRHVMRSTKVPLHFLGATLKWFKETDKINLIIDQTIIISALNAQEKWWDLLHSICYAKSLMSGVYFTLRTQLRFGRASFQVFRGAMCQRLLSWAART